MVSLFLLTGARLCFSQGIGIELSALINTPDLDTTSFASDGTNIGLAVFYEPDWYSSFFISPGIGVMYRNYGYSKDKSIIPYMTFPLFTRLGFKIDDFWVIESTVALEYGKGLDQIYRYPNPNNPSDSSYRLFLHQNDLLSLSWSIGAGIKTERFTVAGHLTFNRQLDSYDLGYGKTVGANSFGLSIRYFLFDN